MSPLIGKVSFDRVGDISDVFDVPNTTCSMSRIVWLTNGNVPNVQLRGRRAFPAKQTKLVQPFQEKEN